MAQDSAPLDRSPSYGQSGMGNSHGWERTTVMGMAGEHPALVYEKEKAEMQHHSKHGDYLSAPPALDFQSSSFPFTWRRIWWRVNVWVRGEAAAGPPPQPAGFDAVLQRMDREQGQQQALEGDIEKADNRINNTDKDLKESVDGMTQSLEKSVDRLTNTMEASVDRLTNSMETLGNRLTETLEAMKEQGGTSAA